MTRETLEDRKRQIAVQGGHVESRKRGNCGAKRNGIP